MSAVLREIKILRLFIHPHIIRLYEIIESATDIYVVMEYVKVGSEATASKCLYPLLQH
jgi:serine/threonine protein kinase